MQNLGSRARKHREKGKRHAWLARNCTAAATTSRLGASERAAVQFFADPQEASEWVDMVSPQEGSHRVPEADWPEAHRDRRARKHTQKPSQSGAPALASMGRINVQLDGTLADEGDELYGHDEIGEQHRHSDSNTDVTGDGQH
ncbi:hypothetical protein NDU88_011046 [Pleurodeles waltl]|uniref:Uncharacterized protein n=1 Tax=Pleurodeles waltl TaxID=8319 RepID=A0AAV7PX11_PLEWA|nr:hypothetical protein NDU88_011046 [Pleurodeles waltl]